MNYITGLSFAGQALPGAETMKKQDVIIRV
jgi:hypothetical protein